MFQNNRLKEDDILKYYATSKIKDKQILLQEASKTGLEGSIYYILLELCTNRKYQSFKKYIVLKESKINTFLEAIKIKKLKNIKVLRYHSKEYYQKLYESKYLINSHLFPNDFIKKDGQIYINIVDETLLTHVGRSNLANPHIFGNKQRNFLMADYIICPNQYTLDTVRQDYMLDNLYSGKYIISRLPKIDIFFNKDRQLELRKELNVENKKIIIYAPIQRRKMYLEDEQIKINELLEYLDAHLDENYIVYSKLSYQSKVNIDYSQYKKVKEIPKNYEFNEILSIADILITDYSSIVFDYANIDHPIISYNYDDEIFKKEIGLYFDLEKDLKISTTNLLEEIIKKVKQLENCQYKTLKEYTLNSTKNSASCICNLLTNQCDLELIDSKKFNNQKENVLIFSGSLIKNGITASLKGLIHNIDLTKRNYYLTFFRKDVKGNKYLLTELPSNIKYIPLDGEKILSKKEKEILIPFLEEEKQDKNTSNILKNIYLREIDRVYPRLKFDYVIDFCGYNKEIINLFLYMDSVKIRYTHSNLKEESNLKNNIHIASLKRAYQTYDKIIVVRDGMKEEVINHFEKIRPKKVELVHNLNDIKNIIDKSNLPIEFQDKTYSNKSVEELEEILNNKNIIKFINIARFSKEKGIERLIRAFYQFSQQTTLKKQECYLILIGGYGKEFENTCNMVENMNLKNVIIIKNIQNPLTILKRCNLYILSSYYEGLPMTIIESLILNIPAMSVDIEGPRSFFKKGYVYLVNNSEEGILNGMNDYVNGKIKGLKKFDAEKFNQEALKEFENIFKI